MNRRWTGRVALGLGMASVLLIGWGTTAAHPNDSGAYGMRSLVRMGEDGLKALVLLEIPIDIVTVQFTQRFITPGIVDPNNIGQAEIDEFNRWQWERMAGALRILIDGETPRGSWVPVDTPINGRANAGFFVYMVYYRPHESWPAFGSEVTVEVCNQLKFEDRPTFLSGYADGKGGWRVLEKSAEAVLGDGASVEEANENPASWSLDATLRQLTVVYAHDDEWSDDDAANVTSNDESGS